MKRGVKIGIICGVIIVLLIIVSIIVYFAFFQKKEYRVVGVEKTDYEVADFAEKSELKFFENKTFHIHIEHKENGLSLSGIGTYTTEGNTYNLKFIQAYARDVNNIIIDVTNLSNEITCTRSGNRIKFTDHKYQIFYFG